MKKSSAVEYLFWNSATFLHVKLIISNYYLSNVIHAHCMTSFCLHLYFTAKYRQYFWTVFHKWTALLTDTIFNSPFLLLSYGNNSLNWQLHFWTLPISKVVHSLESWLCTVMYESLRRWNRHTLNVNILEALKHSCVVYM